MTVSPVRLNHAVLFVADVDRSAGFYTEVFGMDVIDREERMNAVFLRLPQSGNHHDLVCSASARTPGPAVAASGSTTWRGSWTPSTSWPSSAGG